MNCPGLEHITPKYSTLDTEKTAEAENQSLTLPQLSVGLATWELSGFPSPDRCPT
jgi:hypothetical protein